MSSEPSQVSLQPTATRRGEPEALRVPPGVAGNAAEDDRPAVDSAGFGALLLISRDSIGRRIRSMSQQNASQMFEPKSVDPAVRRTAVRNAQLLADLEQDSMRFDQRADVVRRQQPSLDRTQLAAPVVQELASADPPTPTSNLPSLEATPPPRANKAQPVDGRWSPRGEGRRVHADEGAQRTMAATGPQADSTAVQGTNAAAGLTAAPANQLNGNVARGVSELLAREQGPADALRSLSSPAARAPTTPKTNLTKPQPTSPNPAVAKPGGGLPARESERGEFEQLVHSIRMQVGSKRSSARLRLEPPELGRVRVDVRVHGDEIQVDVQAETHAARDALLERADRLKTGLAEHGIRVERFEIVVNAPETTDGGAAPRWGDPTEGRTAASSWGGSRASGSESDQGHANGNWTDGSNIDVEITVNSWSSGARLDIRV